MKKVILLITLIVALFLGACETEGGNKVEELITEEELIEYIQTHDVGLTVSDFDGVDIDDFIAFWGYRPNNISGMTKKRLETYIEEQEWQEKAKYFAKSKISVESTDKEYEKFIKKFFQEIGVDTESVDLNKEFNFNTYYFLVDGERVYIYIAQTKYINELNVITDASSELLQVSLAPSGGAGLISFFCYSKNNKYMMLTEPYDEQLFEYAKIFCRLDD